MVNSTQHTEMLMKSSHIVNNHVNLTDLKVYLMLDITILLNSGHFTVNVFLCVSKHNWSACMLAMQNDGNVQQVGLVGHCDTRQVDTGQEGQGSYLDRERREEYALGGVRERRLQIPKNVTRLFPLKMWNTHVNITCCFLSHPIVQYAS